MPVKKKLKLPEECDKIPLKGCISDKTEGLCQIVKTRKGKKCMPNPDYPEDKDIFEDFFTEFRAMNINEIKEELIKRDKECRNLSKSKCESIRGLKYGCKLSSGWLWFQKKCRLNPDLYDRFFRTNKNCTVIDCNERAFEQTDLCFEHREELIKIIDELKDFQQRLEQGLVMESELNKVVSKDEFGNKFTLLEEFEGNINYINEIYSVYLLEHTDVARYILTLQRDINRRLGREKRCQATNISSCNGRGKESHQCTNTGIKGKEGIFCGIHKKCYQKYLKSYKKVRDNYIVICKKSPQLCKEWVKEMNLFSQMISKCSDGEAVKLKGEVTRDIAIVKQLTELINNILVT